MSLADAIKKEIKSKRIPLEDSRCAKIRESFDSLFAMPPIPEQELAFERQLFSRGTGCVLRAGLHVSSITTAPTKYCPREQVLALLYAPRDMGRTTNPALLRIWEEGNFIHKKWQRLFLRGGLCAPEDLDRTRYNQNYMLQYSPDAEINLFNKNFIVEIKSMNCFIYDKTEKHVEGEKQLRMYMYLSGIKNGIILMENKNTQDFKLNIISHNEDKIVEFISRLEFIKSCYEAKTMPDRHDQCKTELSKRCQECAYSIPCWCDKSLRKGLLLKNAKFE